MKTITKKLLKIDTPETVTGACMTGRMPSKAELKVMELLVKDLKAKSEVTAIKSRSVAK